MDYSLLLGIHDCERAAAEAANRPIEQTSEVSLIFKLEILQPVKFEKLLVELYPTSQCTLSKAANLHMFLNFAGISRRARPHPTGLAPSLDGRVPAYIWGS